MTRSSVDITLPVLNEERAIEDSLSTLIRYLSEHCRYDWYITVADNGSTDRTWAIADAFAATDARLRTIRLDKPGRGGALKASWSTSTADIVCYMDVDLSTDLGSLDPLLRPIVEDRYDLSVGSRLMAGAVIERSMQREVISHIYNAITRTVLGYHIRDAQCGFKAMRADLARELIPLIEDDGWFFDTELLFLAWQRHLRINEVPVRWVEDDDSRVRIVRTALDDLRGIWRIHRSRSRSAQSADARSRSSLASAPETDRTVDFDAFAAGYETSVDRSISFTGRDSDFFASRKVEILSELARSCVGPLDAVTTLDVGCGTGTTDRHLVGLVKELHGVDVSEEMLAGARQNVPTGTFRWYDGEMLPYADDRFDLVVAICVLHHIPVSQRFKIVSEMVRVTRHGGLVAIFEHNPLNPLTRHAVNSCELDKDAILISAKESLGLLRAAAGSEPQQRHFLFSPFSGRLGHQLDKSLRRIPLGGQYVAWVTRPKL